MAIQTYLLEGFDQHTVTLTQLDDANGKWEASYGLSYGDVRTGTRALGLGETAWINFKARESLRMVVIGFAVKFATLRDSSTERFLSIYGGDQFTSEIQLELGMDTSGHLTLYRGSAATGTLLDTGTTVLQANAWYYLELRAYIDNTNGEYEVKIDNVSEFSDSTVDTQNSATYNNFIRFQLACDSSGAAIGMTSVDDVYVRGDPTTNTAGGWFGPISVKVCMPDANGTDRDWTPSTGTDDFAVVDEIPYSSADYLYDSTDGNQVTMGFANCSSGATIKSVILNNYSHIASGGGRNMIPLCRSNGTVYQGSTRKVVQVAYEVFEAYDVDPDTSSAWTESAFNAAEFGVETD